MKYDLNNMEAIEIYKLVLSGKIKKFPRGFWMQPEAKDNAAKVTKYLLEDILHYTEDDIRTKVNGTTFADNKLRGMLNNVFGNSIYKCIDNAYPGKFKEWELSSTPKNFWNKETAKEATKWLLGEKLHYTEEDIKTRVNTNTFRDNGLSGMVSVLFDYSTYKCLDNAYPNKFKEWELSTVPKNFWNKETARDATKWLLEEKLKYSKEDIKTKINTNTFINNGLSGILRVLFKGSVKECLKNAYPELFE